MTQKYLLLHIINISLILTLISGCSGGCTKREKSAGNKTDIINKPMVLLIKNRTDPSSTEMSGQLARAFSYSRIPYETVDLDLISSDFPILSSVQVIYITTGEVEQLDDNMVQWLLIFIARGNHLVILTPLYDDRFSYFAGLDPSKEYKQDTFAQGFYFNEHVFPDFKGNRFKPSGKYLHSGFVKDDFVKNKEVIATASNDSTYPAIVKRTIGSGDVIFFNSSTMGDKEYRGLIFSAGMRALNGVPYRIANEATIFIDDFPAPLYDKKLPPVKKEYDMTHAEFVTKVWWPDMKALADTFNLNYTTMLAFNYNVNVVPPFDFNEWLNGRLNIAGEEQYGSVFLARGIVKSRHELGFHGYNHISLWGKDWQSEAFMISALQAAKKRWKIDRLGRLPITYVPPTNEIDSLGLDAVRRAMPSLNVMSSLYLGELEDGGDREFGPDPYSDHFFDYPRITSGYVDNESNLFKQQNLFILTGIWTHFIHPDDVFQVMQRGEDDFSSRNPLGLGWKSDKNHDYGLYDVFRDRIIETQKTYPFLRFSTAGRAVPVVKNWLSTETNYQLDSKKIKVISISNSDSKENRRKFWFMYVQNKDTSNVNGFLKEQFVPYVTAPWWSGRLYQLSTTSDTLRLPALNTAGKDNVPKKITEEDLLLQYKNYINKDKSGVGTEPDSLGEDTRFRDALAALHQDPDSYKRQENVINLAVEFDSVKTAIPILEKRLADHSVWRTSDIERLLTYYGWEEQVRRAWEFLEKLWQEYHDDSVIKLKNMMVIRYGSPDRNIQNKWLNRELELHPEDKSVLRKLITTHQSEESWPQTRQYLSRLINEYPQSDSLYLYTLQRSFYYDSAKTTFKLLNSFPESAELQLQSLAADIANLYAYTGNNYSEALYWADRAPDFPVQPKLEWIMQQKRYYEFIQRSDRYLGSHPKDDSLRAFSGRQLIYEGYAAEGYRLLYPLFKKEKATSITRKLVHTEIGYKSYEEKKEFFQRYPAFFADSLRADLFHQYRINEGMKAGLTGSYATDNFHNTIGRAGGFAEWGNRQKYTHRFLAEETFISSDIGLSSLLHTMHHVYYRYQRQYRRQSIQSTTGGGLYYVDSGIRPEFNIGLSYSRDSTFTSGILTFEPVFTNSAIQRKINQLRASFYREDFWSGDRFQTTISWEGTRYSNDVYSYEALTRFYVLLPFSTACWKVRPVAELSYSDATRSYLSGVPYYTPDNLFVKGVGGQFSYRYLLDNPNFSLEMEVLAKHDKSDGFFMTSSARLNARIHEYWKLSVNADLSSSTVYRYNNFGITLSYTFPKHLYPK